jgi:Mor family transcriptional regulator
VEDALYKLADRTDEISDPEAFLVALFSVADNFPSKSQDSLLASPRALAVEIARRVLEQETDERQTREELLSSVLESTNSLLFSCRLVEEIDEVEKQRRGDTEDVATYSDEVIEKCQAQCVAKIEDAAADGLLHNESLLYLLVKWYRWGDEQKPKNWLRGVLDRDDENVFRVLRGFRRGSKPEERQTMYERYANSSSYAIAVEWLDRFGVLEIVRQLVTELEDDEISDEKESLIQAFSTVVEIYQDRVDNAPVEADQDKANQNGNDKSNQNDEDLGESNALQDGNGESS